MKKFLLLSLVSLCLVLPVQASAESTYFFEGIFDTAEEKLDLSFQIDKDSLIETALTMTARNHFQVESKLIHIKTPFFEISTVLESSFELVREHNGSSEFYRGSIRSKYSLIDSKPVPELSGSFEIRKGKLIIHSLYWGENICEGYIGLLPPYDFDMKIHLVDIPAYDFFKWTGYAENNANISGLITGSLEMSGFHDKLLVKGSIKSIDGVFEELEYDTILLNFEGVYPLLSVQDSVISQPNGLIFGIEGTFDFARTDSKSIAKEFSQLKFFPLVDESMEHREWTIKRREEKGTSSLTEFKYRLNKDDPNTPFGDQADMLGIERSIRF